jgi:pimeloyl-ACP methyl ester carboxylesterase
MFPDRHLAHPEVVSRFAGTRRNEEQKQRRAGILTRPVEFDLSSISSPTLVLAGSEDRLIPKALTLSLAREIAGAKTAIIAGVCHVGTIQDPAAMAFSRTGFELC